MELKLVVFDLHCGQNFVGTISLLVQSQRERKEQNEFHEKPLTDERPTGQLSQLTLLVLEIV